MSPELIALIVGVALAIIVGFAMRTQRRKRRQTQAAAQQAWLDKRQTQTAKYLKPGLSFTSPLPRAIHRVDPSKPTATSAQSGTSGVTAGWSDDLTQAALLGMLLSNDTAPHHAPSAPDSGTGSDDTSRSNDQPGTGDTAADAPSNDNWGGVGGSYDAPSPSPSQDYGGGNYDSSPTSYDSGSTGFDSSPSSFD